MVTRTGRHDNPGLARVHSGLRTGESTQQLLFGVPLFQEQVMRLAWSPRTTRPANKARSAGLVGLRDPGARERSLGSTPRLEWLVK
jgi:hypothetical protein